MPLELTIIDVLPCLGIDAGRVGSHDRQLSGLHIIAGQMFPTLSPSKVCVVDLDLHPPDSAKIST